MEHIAMQVRMLGGFSLSWNGKEINDADNRMKKVWLLLGYLVYRRSVVTPEEVTNLLWEGDEDQNNSPSALKTIFYRTRTLLNQLGEGVGQTLILRRDGGYIWNPEIPMELDVLRVDKLYQKIGASSDETERLELRCQLLDQYRGDFLSKLSSESWVVPIAAYYHRLYLETAGEVLEALSESERWDEVVALSNAALKIEPYSEELYCHLIRGLLARGERDKAAATYVGMSELLFSHFGVMPSDTARGLYRLATRSDGTGTNTIGNIKEMLREEDTARGALYCEYDFFRIIYQSQARAIARSGDTVHIALITVAGRRGKELPRRSLDLAVNNLKELLVGQLRRGDVVTQCSMSQLLFMLPQANYENSCKVCERMVRAFARTYPHSPAELTFSVHPLEPIEDSGRGQTR